MYSPFFDGKQKLLFCMALGFGLIAVATFVFDPGNSSVSKNGLGEVVYTPTEKEKNKTLREYARRTAFMCEDLVAELHRLRSENNKLRSQLTAFYPQQEGGE